MKLIKNFLLLVLIFMAYFSSGQRRIAGAIGFYNVENLFDTQDDPSINDEEFLPDGDRRWSNDRYKDKLGKLGKVINQMAYGVDILGLAEVENRKVLEDLTNSAALSKLNYKIVHKDSPDGRGIDVALIYKANKFRVIHSQWIEYPEDGYLTRDVLLCTGLYASDTITIGVNHWPSRRSGPEKRNQIAARLKVAIDSMYQKSKNAKIILMGDFNDDPRNASVKKYLGATDKPAKVDENGLFNASAETYQQGHGTLYYRGAWNLFDQIIVSKPLLNSEGLQMKKSSFSIFGPEWMRNKDGQYAGGPFRSFSFDKYIGGYSDHFPVYILLEK